MLRITSGSCWDRQPESGYCVTTLVQRPIECSRKVIVEVIVLHFAQCPRPSQLLHSVPLPCGGTGVIEHRRFEICLMLRSFWFRQTAWAGFPSPSKVYGEFVSRDGWAGLNRVTFVDFLLRQRRQHGLNLVSRHLKGADRQFPSVDDADASICRSGIRTRRSVAPRLIDQALVGPCGRGHPCPGDDRYDRPRIHCRDEARVMTCPVAIIDPGRRGGPGPGFRTHTIAAPVGTTRWLTSPSASYENDRSMENM